MTKAANWFHERTGLSAKDVEEILHTFHKRGFRGAVSVHIRTTCDGAARLFHDVMHIPKVDVIQHPQDIVDDPRRIPNIPFIVRVPYGLKSESLSALSKLHHNSENAGMMVYLSAFTQVTSKRGIPFKPRYSGLNDRLLYASDVSFAQDQDGTFSVARIGQRIHHGGPLGHLI